ncbi:hypothetical protein HK100_001565 [Physocladia obscura]|uniref:Uncharacterized protein n=1 Tax=Physocladia obscura TaxID=109957 RepID=A0AAD5SYN0_9FUNG|nr:hypothetical protein HK100_001565 [Physocladia obscura]
MSTTQKPRRSRVQDPKLSITKNPQVSKQRGSSPSLFVSPPDSSPNATARNTRSSRNTVNAFWGEDGKKSSQSGSGLVEEAVESSEIEAKVSVRDWYSKLNAEGPERSSVVQRRKVLFETQQIMPSPGTTYFQLVIETDRVLLRDWPRQRFSQKWTRDGSLNPGQKIIKIEDFLNKDSKAELVYIFGNEVYEKAVEVARQALS